MKLATLLLLSLPGISFADDPFACVDPDVADAFLGNPYQGRPEYSTSVPEGFVLLDVPDGLSLVGSQTDGTTTTVVYKADMDPDPALNSAIDALAESGWVERTAQHRMMGRGFQSRSRPTATVVCHENAEDALTVFASIKSGQTFIAYAQYPGTNMCSQRPSAQSSFNPDQMSSHLPILELPDGARATHSGSGGSGAEASSRVDITSDLGQSELQSHFEDQMRNQNWVFETSWSSHLSTGSVWTLRTEDDETLIGTLHLFGAGTDTVRIRFSVSSTDPKRNSRYGSWSSTGSAVTM